MLQEYLAVQFEAALLQLRNEINSYTHSENIWKTSGEISNSAGTLALHLVGNLRHFVGHVLAHTEYVRNREKEFSERNVPAARIIKEIDEVSYLVKNSISGLSDDQLYGAYPLLDGKQAKMTAQRLVHLFGHLQYHIGQINYHRRLLDQPASLPDDVFRLEKRK